MLNIEDGQTIGSFQDTKSCYHSRIRNGLQANEFRETKVALISCKECCKTKFSFNDIHNKMLVKVLSFRGLVCSSVSRMNIGFQISELTHCSQSPGIPWSFSKPFTSSRHFCLQRQGSIKRQQIRKSPTIAFVFKSKNGRSSQRYQGSNGKKGDCKQSKIPWFP